MNLSRRWRWRALLLAACALAAAPVPAQAVPSFAQVKAAHAVSDLTLLDRHGVPLQTLRMDDRVRRLPWVRLEDLSPALQQAIVMSEDRRFWTHAGVDWQALARSAWANLRHERRQGASTLTMQLAGLIDAGLARPAGGRSAWQKLGQVVLARQLEARWSKAQILEAYLNSVPLRGELVGIAALAQTLFAKHPSGLDAQEAAIAAALVRAPNADPDRVAQRACGVLAAMRTHDPGSIVAAEAAPESARPPASDAKRLPAGNAVRPPARNAARASAPAGDPACQGLELRTALALQRRGGMPLGEQIAPHFARLALARGGAAAQRSTLDARLQRLAVALLQRQLAELQGRNVEDGAVVVLDNASGAPLAWVGAHGASAAAQVDGVLARRQPGSALKPFVYALAFERRLLTPASLLEDTPTEIGTANGAYVPQNYDHRYKGLVSARTALGASLNIPAVRVGAMLPPDALHSRLNALGLALPQPAGWYGASLALGSADVTLLALANAYRTLANGGLYTPPALPGTPRSSPRRVLDAGVAYLVSDILADNNARVPTFGLDSALRTRGFAAVKTGTSKDMRDNWCVGFSDRYTVAVWVGNASGAPMHDVSGISGAAPIWQALMQALHADLASRPPPVPAGVQAQRVDYAGGEEASRAEWFLAGTAPRQAIAARSPARRSGIVRPREGTVYALDPDMPAAVQRIRIEGERGRWLLDGQPLGQGEQLHWSPWPGRHELRLLAADGREIERVRFEVRGASLKPRAPASAPGAASHPVPDAASPASPAALRSALRFEPRSN